MGKHQEFDFEWPLSHEDPAALQQIKELLEQRARECDPITYSELLEKVRFTLRCLPRPNWQIVVPWSNEEAAVVEDFLGRLSTDTEPHGFMLSVFVVRGNDYRLGDPVRRSRRGAAGVLMMPGERFFDLARELNFKFDDRDEFVNQQMHAAHKHYAAR